MDFHTSSLLAYLCNNLLTFWRRKRTAVQHLPNQSNTKKKNLTNFSDHRKGKQAHQSIRHHTHMRTTTRLQNQTRPQASEKVTTEKDHHISPLTEDFRDLHRKQTVTSSFDSPKFCSLISPLLFSSFHPLLISSH